MEIINYTHYSTEDIKTIVDKVAASEGFTGWGIDQLTLTEFNPKNPYESRGRSYHYNNTGAKVKKYTSKMRWSVRGSLSLLVPAKIYENPLEALSQGEVQNAPAAMVKAIVLALRERANFNHYNAHTPEAEGLILRVLPKAEQRRPKSGIDTLESRNTYARRNLSAPCYDARRAIRELSASQKKNLKSARTHLKDRAKLVDPVDVAINNAIHALGLVIEAAENARQAL
jgi:hypothetical protein